MKTGIHSPVTRLIRRLEVILRHARMMMSFSKNTAAVEGYVCISIDRTIGSTKFK